MSVQLLNFSPNSISIGTSNSISNSILTTKSLNIQSNNLMNNSPLNATNGKQLIFTDSNNKTIGWFGEHFFSNEYQAFSMFSKREINNENYYNGFYLGINSKGNPIITLHDNNCKKAWQKALNPDVLYLNTTGNSVNSYPIDLTLNGNPVSAANYDHMRIYYTNSNGVNSSVDVVHPNGKNVDMFIGGTGNNGGSYWPQATSVYIEGTQIRIAGSNNTYTYYMDTSASTSTQRTTVCRLAIYIYCVEAW